MTWCNDDMRNPSFLSHRGTANMFSRTASNLPWFQHCMETKTLWEPKVAPVPAAVWSSCCRGGGVARRNLFVLEASPTLLVQQSVRNLPSGPRGTT